MIIPIWLKALLVLAVIAGWSAYCYDLGYDKKDLEVKTEYIAKMEEAQKIERELREDLAKTSERLQKALGQVRIETVYVDRITTREIEKPIYSQCIVPESGVVIIRDNAERLNSLRDKK